MELGGFNIPINMPDVSGVGNSITTIILVGLVVLLIVGIGAFGIWAYFQRKMYNKKIIVFENIGNMGYQKTGEDTARLIKVGDGGEEILLLRDRKTYKTAYGKKMGKDTYWFAVGQDGYWYNIVLGDLDAKMGMLDIEPIDRDMRYMSVAIRKNISERYKKIGFMEKYGTIVANSIFLIIMLVGVWFLIDKMASAIKILVDALTQNKEMLELMKTSLSNLDSICSGGSGFTHA